MRIFLMSLPALALLSTAAAAEITKDQRKSIDQVAWAVTSGQTCSDNGYEVDFVGIAAFRQDVKKAAIAEGAEESEFSGAIDANIEAEYARLEKRFKNGMTTRANSERLQAWWGRRCKDLSKDEATSHLFSKAG